MSKFDLIFLILLWSIPAATFIRRYVKLPKNEQTEFWNSIKKPSVFFEDVFRHLGMLLLFTGIIEDFPVLKKIGIFMILTSVFALGVNTWELNKKKSMIVMFIPLIFAVFYIFFSFKEYLF
ncbi:hypothetical protein [Fictibacillus barbaricus]|uniref:DoxX family protein n=1 Tax=Fictibacillus barbaricus TaxID=182136 RepID=A0ABU1U1E4_9BACL|nr:hypothetical protein [Fictibacillus barbaricus]MDR7073250.1 hypothetical protein [Fictibacillus barbaricus]